MDAPSRPPQKIGLSGIYFWGNHSEQERVEYIINEIVSLLRQHPRREQSEAEVRHFVATASVFMMCAGASQRLSKAVEEKPAVPKAVQERLERIRGLSKQLLVELKDSPLQLDMLLFGENRVLLPREETQAFCTVGAIRDKTDRMSEEEVVNRVKIDPKYEEEWGAKDRFTKQLVRITRANYKAPHFNTDSVKDLSAQIADWAISHYSNFVPKNTRKNPFKDLPGLFYEIACPSLIGELAVLKRARAKVSKKTG